MRAQDLLKEVSEAEARSIAAASMGLPAEAVKLAAATDQVRVFQGEVVERKWRFFTSRRRPVRAVDREGVIRVQRSDGIVLGATRATGIAQLRRCWEEVTIYNGDSVITPDVFVIAGRRVVDLSGDQRARSGHDHRPQRAGGAAGRCGGRDHRRAGRAGRMSGARGRRMRTRWRISSPR